MNHPIHDLFVKPLQAAETGQGEVLPLLRRSDQVLRRFGLAELHRVQAGKRRPSSVRSVADELWALIAGSVEFDWDDRRQGSPTRGETYRLRCDQPTLVLVPFGVAFGITALDGPAELVRFSTHEETDE